MTKKLVKKRNDVLFDNWSIAHLASGIVMAWLISPIIAMILIVLWEPFEILILSPILGRFGITFGFETLRNSLSDIVFDIAGVLIGAYVLRTLIDPPFQLL